MVTLPYKHWIGLSILTRIVIRWIDLCSLLPRLHTIKHVNMSSLVPFYWPRSLPANQQLSVKNHGNETSGIPAVFSVHDHKNYSSKKPFAKEDIDNHKRKQLATSIQFNSTGWEVELVKGNFPHYIKFSEIFIFSNCSSGASFLKTTNNTPSLPQPKNFHVWVSFTIQVLCTTDSFNFVSNDQWSGHDPNPVLASFYLHSIT